MLEEDSVQAVHEEGGSRKCKASRGSTDANRLVHSINKVEERPMTVRWTGVLA